MGKQDVVVVLLIRALKILPGGYYAMIVIKKYGARNHSINEFDC